MPLFELTFMRKALAIRAISMELAETGFSGRVQYL